MHADDRTRLRWTALGGEHGGGGIGPPGTAASTGGVDGRLNTREATAGVRSLLAYPRTAGVRGYARICEGGGGRGTRLSHWAGDMCRSSLRCSSSCRPSSPVMHTTPPLRLHIGAAPAQPAGRTTISDKSSAEWACRSATPPRQQAALPLCAARAAASSAPRRTAPQRAAGPGTSRARAPVLPSRSRRHPAHAYREGLHIRTLYSPTFRREQCRNTATRLFCLNLSGPSA